MSTEPGLSDGNTPTLLNGVESNGETVHVWLAVSITGAVSCILLMLMFGLFMYSNRKKSLELEAIRLMIEHHLPRSENSSQESRSQVFNPLNPSPVPSQQQTMPDMSECSTQPIFDVYNTTIRDFSTPASPLRSPFSEHNVTIPNAFSGSEVNTLLIGSESTGFSARGLNSSEIKGRSIDDLDRQNCDPSEHEYPELNYDIRLLDVDLPELGKGACGQVKEAIYVTPTGEVWHVAAKYARDSSVDPLNVFRSELEIISKLPLHQNIVQCFGGNIAEMESRRGSNHDDCFIVMELLFTNLQDVIHGNILPSKMNYSLILQISLDVVHGLDHLHKHGIIHYDLKPSNVLLNEDLVAKLADFGSSKKTLRSCTTGTFRGTIGYIAPEVLLCQFVSKMKVTERLDIYSLGVMIWEMVTGENPPNPTSSYSSSFRGSFSRNTENPLLFRRSFLHAETERCPPCLRSLIEECLKIEPHERPSTKDVKHRLLEMHAAQKSM